MLSSSERVAVVESVKRAAWPGRPVPSADSEHARHRRQQARGGQGGEARPSGLIGFDPGHFRRQPQDLTQVPADTDRQDEHDQRVQPQIVREDPRQDGAEQTGHHRDGHQKDQHA